MNSCIYSSLGDLHKLSNLTCGCILSNCKDILYCLLVHCVTPCDTTTHILGVSSDNPQCIKLNIIDMSPTFDFSGGSNSDV